MKKRGQPAFEVEHELKAKKHKKQDIFSKAREIFSTTLGSELKSLESRQPLNLIGDIKSSPLRNRPVYKQILQGNIEELEKLLADPERSPYIHRFTELNGVLYSPPFFWACQMNLEATHLLLKCGADPRHFNHNSFSPLVFVMQGGRREILESLLVSFPDLLSTLNLMSWRWIVEQALSYAHSSLLIDLGHKIIETKNKDALSIYSIILYAKGCHSLKFMINAEKIMEFFGKRIDIILSVGANNNPFLIELFNSDPFFNFFQYIDNQEAILANVCETNNDTIFNLILTNFPYHLRQDTFHWLIEKGKISFLDKYISTYPQALSWSEAMSDCAVKSGQKEIVSFLCQKYPDHFQFCLKNNEKSGELLKHAAAKGHVELVKWFYEMKIDFNVTNPGLYNLAHLARHTVILDYLSQVANHLLDQPAQNGYHPICTAVKYDKLETFEWFLKNKPSRIAWLDNKDNSNLVHLAATFKAIKILKFLSSDNVYKSASLFFSPNTSGETPVVSIFTEKEEKMENQPVVLEWFHQKYPDTFKIEIGGLNLFQYIAKRMDLNINTLHFFRTHYPQYFRKPETTSALEPIWSQRRNIFNYATIFEISAWVQRDLTLPWPIADDDWKMMRQYVYIYLFLISTPQEVCYYLPAAIINITLGYAANNACEEMVAALLASGNHTSRTTTQKPEQETLSNPRENFLSRMLILDPHVRRLILETDPKTPTTLLPAILTAMDKRKRLDYQQACSAQGNEIKAGDLAGKHSIYGAQSISSSARFLSLKSSSFA